MNPARDRIEAALRPYLGDVAARLRAVELARALRDCGNEAEARDRVARILGKLDYHHSAPSEALPAMVDVVILAWTVIPLKSGDDERG